MPKPTRGGRRSPVPTPASTPAPPAQTKNKTLAVDDEEEKDDNTLSTDTRKANNPVFDGFRKMTDDEKADVIAAALQEAPPSVFPDNASQRLLWHLGGDNKPTIVPDAQLDTMPGVDIYRQVAGVHDTKFGTNLSSQQIANQVMTGDLTQYATSWGSGSTGAGGGTAFGRAIYFGASYSEIKNYYGTARNIRGRQDSTMFRCKINQKSRGMTYSQLRSNLAREMSSGSKLGRTLSSISNSDDRETCYALAKGIDYTHDGSHDYHMIYNRGCLIASQKMKHNTTDSRW